MTFSASLEPFWPPGRGWCQEALIQELLIQVP
jgi:hypothetical protein